MTKNTDKLKGTFNFSLKNFLGILLIVIGIAGLFLPLLQGIIFITVGLILLGNKKILAKLKRLKDYLKEKFFKSNN